MTLIKQFFKLFSLLIFTISLPPYAYAQTLIKDINVSGNSMKCGNNEMVKFGPYLFFVADDGIHGKELWRTNGASNGTILVTDVWAGPGGSDPTQLVVLGANLFFVANDGTGIQLWKLPNSSSLVPQKITLEAGFPTEYIRSLTRVGNSAYFLAKTPNKGSELWKYTSGNAAICLESQPGANGVDAILQSYGNKTLWGDYYEIAYDQLYNRLYWFGGGSISTSTLWRYDIGAPAPTGVGPFNSVNAHLQPPVTLNGRVYFMAYGSSFQNYELYYSDGVTIDHHEINAGSSSSTPCHLTKFGNNIYFLAATSGFSASLVKVTNANIIVPFTTIFSGEFNSQGFPADNIFRIINNQLLYQHGSDIWRLAPTPSSAPILTDFYANINESHLIKLGSNYYYSRYENNDMPQIYKNSVGTPITTFDGICHGTLNPLVIYGTKFYFSASKTTTGWELWRIP